MKFVAAVTSPKKSAKVVDTAARHARALDAELVILRVVPDPEKVGVVAQLISSERPHDKAKEHVDRMVGILKEKGTNVRGEIRVGEVAPSIVTAAKELEADLLFAGASNPDERNLFFMRNDPVLSYVVENSEISVFVVKGETDENLEKEYGTPDDSDDSDGDSGSDQTDEKSETEESG